MTAETTPGEKLRDGMLNLADLLDQLNTIRGTRRNQDAGRRNRIPDSRPPIDIELVGAITETEQWIDHLRHDLAHDPETKHAFRLKCPHPLNATSPNPHTHPQTGETWGNCLTIPANLLRHIARDWSGHIAKDPDQLECETWDLNQLLAAARRITQGDARRITIPDARCEIPAPCGGRLYAILKDGEEEPAEIRCDSGDETHTRPRQEWMHLGLVIRQQREDPPATMGA